MHVVVPDGIDDPPRPSGGNIYDRRLCEELARPGGRCACARSPGAWPRPAEAERERSSAALRGAARRRRSCWSTAWSPRPLPDGRWCRAAGRLRVVVLVHMPLGRDAAARLHRGGAVPARAAAAVVTTERLDRGLAAGEPTAWTPGGSTSPGPGSTGAAGAAAPRPVARLLCVGAVTPDKGHDVLLAALAARRRPVWRCTCVGSLTVAPDFVDRLRRDAADPASTTGSR